MSSWSKLLRAYRNIQDRRLRIFKADVESWHARARYTGDKGGCIRKQKRRPRAGINLANLLPVTRVTSATHGLNPATKAYMSSWKLAWLPSCSCRPDDA
ncbi:hypothetical protein A0H81_00918 [Grifola frondosa]|uniref:Uncharacterized protein n=1 Tax=Grifola frondosa TaxID=5627 RepID=A0A1C7MSS0_GRIFR|nr:hypothetical protein A0H81_00918 [Grifola frondosa]